MVSNKKASTSWIISLLFLGVLMYTFRTELFITGVRVFASVTHSPRSEQLLGNYYRNSARLNTVLANTFYVSALQKYESDLPQAKDEEKTRIQFNIGKLYQCGKGVPKNLNEAKRWYHDALKSANTKHPAMAQNIQKALNDVTESAANSNNLSSCYPSTEEGFVNYLD